jgi:hypothetical protein
MALPRPQVSPPPLVYMPGHANKAPHRHPMSLGNDDAPHQNTRTTQHGMSGGGGDNDDGGNDCEGRRQGEEATRGGGGVWRWRGDEVVRGGGGRKAAAPYEPLLIGWFVCAISARRRETMPLAPAPHYCEHLARSVERVLTVGSPPPRQH